NARVHTFPELLAQRSGDALALCCLPQEFLHSPIELTQSAQLIGERRMSGAERVECSRPRCGIVPGRELEIDSLRRTQRTLRNRGR
ncbi:MAG: hypothetical protein RL277_281, partial [Planctomycetota bacterium]